MVSSFRGVVLPVVSVFSFRVAVSLSLVQANKAAIKKIKNVFFMFQVFCHCLSSNYTAKTGLNIPMEIVCVCNRKAIVGIRCSCIKKPISDHYDTYHCIIDGLCENYTLRTGMTFYCLIISV